MSPCSSPQIVDLVFALSPEDVLKLILNRIEEIKSKKDNVITLLSVDLWSMMIYHNNRDLRPAEIFLYTKTLLYRL